MGGGTFRCFSAFTSIICLRLYALAHRQSFADIVYLGFQFKQLCVRLYSTLYRSKWPFHPSVIDRNTTAVQRVDGWVKWKNKFLKSKEGSFSIDLDGCIFYGATLYSQAKQKHLDHLSLPLFLPSAAVPFTTLFLLLMELDFTESLRPPCFLQVCSSHSVSSPNCEAVVDWPRKIVNRPTHKYTVGWGM